MTNEDKLNWKLKIGNFLFKHRTFTPIPMIILVFVLFKPRDLGQYNMMINLAGLCVSMLGEFIRIMAVGFSFPGTSGRETYLRADNLNTSGIYSITRNPLYIGNFFMFTGLVAVFANPWAVLCFAVFSVVQYHFIILSEENFLMGIYGSDYEEYRGRVRKIWPTFKNYTKNRNRFSGKKVLFKEKDSVFNMLVMFILVMLYKEKVFYGGIMNWKVYAVSGGVLVIIYIIVKILKQKSLK